MKVLIACEFSGIVRDAFRAAGHDAWSCDLLCCERGPDHHYRCDVLTILDQNWDLMVGFPPCTYLSYAGTAHWNKPGRAEKRQLALDFFLQLYNAPIPKVALENPLGYVHNAFRRPDQTINPFQFGDRKRKRICLWLRNLPPLQPTNIVEPPEPAYLQTSNGKVKNRWSMDALHASCPTRAQRRSRFFPGIAAAMADQWGNL